MSQYIEAMQYPRTSLTDTELKLGRPEMQNSFGTPLCVPGGFAYVFKIHCAKKVWAVRCFMNESVDREQRYLAIYQHLKNAALPYTVEVDYQQEGIWIGKQRYPILKMEWVDGNLLHSYVRTHLHNATALYNLANRWVVMARRLKQEKIAHSDLQHGNVKVVNGNLKLIDYDGMYVPDLANKPSPDELGHPNYQHPQRKISDFGPNLDHFSLWLIYLSLVALSVDPGIWAKVKGGDECLILREKDLINPSQSKALEMLGNHPDDRIRNLTVRLRSFLTIDPMRVPPLDPRTSQTLTKINLSQQRRVSQKIPFFPQMQAPFSQKSVFNLAGEVNQGITSSLTAVKPYITRRNFLKGLAGLAAIGGIATGLIVYHAASTPQLGDTLLIYHGHTDIVNTVAWSSDGNYVVSGGDDKSVQVWDAQIGKRLLSYHDHTEAVFSVKWSPNGQSIASGSSDTTVRVWNAISGHTQLTYRGHTGTVYTVAWSPDGKYLASGGRDMTVQIWNATTGKLVLTFGGHKEAVRAIAWSPDGQYIASGGADGTIEVWYPFSGNEFIAHQGNSSLGGGGVVYAIAWSPDSKYIVTGGTDAVVKEWNPIAGIEPLHRYIGHKGDVHAVAWSSDGKYLASGGKDKTVQVWNVSSGNQVQVYRRHTGLIADIAWSPDNKKIASASNDKTVQVWQGSL